MNYTRVLEHSILTEGDYAASIKAGRRKVVFCNVCLAVIAWDEMTPPTHVHCGGSLLELFRATSQEVGRMIEDLDEELQRQKERVELDTRYPFPERPPYGTKHTYTCAACKKKYELDWDQAGHADRRLCCSAACEVKWIGKEKPRDRRFAGFCTLAHCFKGSKVFYIGSVVTPVRLKGRYVDTYIEVYLWGSEKQGSLYGYYGDGEHDHLLSRYSNSLPLYYEGEPLWELFEHGTRVDESWRVAANAVNGWTLPDPKSVDA